jgi:hypothetical protein
MTEAIKQYEPDVLVVGDTWKWRRNIPNRSPSDSWVLTYALINKTDKITLTATDNGDGTHLINELPATSASHPSGEFSWQAYVTLGTDRYTVGVGSIVVESNFTAEDSGDFRSSVKQQLDAVEALLINKASRDQLSMSIAGRSISRMSPDELLKWRYELRKEWRSELGRMRQRSGFRASGKIRQRL